MRVRTAPLVVGTGLLVAGAAVLAGVVPVPDSLPGGVLLAPLVVAAVVAASLGGLRALSRASRGTTRLGLPTTRCPEVVRVPGRGFDRELATLPADLDEGARDRRDELRTRIERVALSTLVYGGDCTVATARAALERGTWTDDERAAAFFATADGTGEPGVRERVDALVAGEPVFALRARRAVAELAAYDGTPLDPPGGEHPRDGERSPDRRDGSGPRSGPGSGTTPASDPDPDLDPDPERDRGLDAGAVGATARFGARFRTEVADDD